MYIGRVKEVHTFITIPRRSTSPNFSPLVTVNHLAIVRTGIKPVIRVLQYVYTGYVRCVRVMQTLIDRIREPSTCSRRRTPSNRPRVVDRRLALCHGSTLIASQHTPFLISFRMIFTVNITQNQQKEKGIA